MNNTDSSKGGDLRKLLFDLEGELKHFNDLLTGSNDNTSFKLDFDKIIIVSAMPRLKTKISQILVFIANEMDKEETLND